MSTQTQVDEPKNEVYEEPYIEVGSLHVEGGLTARVIDKKVKDCSLFLKLKCFKAETGIDVARKLAEKHGYMSIPRYINAKDNFVEVVFEK